MGRPDGLPNYHATKKYNKINLSGIQLNTLLLSIFRAGFEPIRSFPERRYITLQHKLPECPDIWNVAKAKHAFNIPEIKLVHEYPRLGVKAQKGEVFNRVDTGLTGLALKTREKEIIGRIEEIALTLGGAQKVKVSLGHAISLE